MHTHPLRPSTVALAACALALTSLPLAAQSSATANDSQAPTGEATFEIGRVLVTGRRAGPLPTRSLLTSVDVLNADLIQAQAVQATWELFSLVPGALLTNFNQGTTSGKVSLRGFNGEGNINAVKLLIDGIPSNSNDGNMPYLDAVMPLETEAIEVVRGTNDARYGQHNIAGNLNLVTRRGGSYSQGAASLGSFNSLDVQAGQGIQTGAWTQNYFVGHKQSDGWRAHADSRKTTLSGQWFYTAADWSAGLTARHFTHDAQEPGYLTLAQTRADPWQSNDFVATDGGERRIGQVALHLDWRAGQSLDASLKAYVNRFADERWVKFSAGVSQQDRLTDETHKGARAALSWRPQLAGWHSLAIEGGADVEQQDNRSQRYNSAQRVRVSQTRDQTWTQDSTGLYAQAVLQPVASVKLVPGWRVDWLRGHFNNLRSGVQAPMYDYGAIQQPKLSAVWTPLPATSVYANWGRSFQVGLGAGAYKVPPLTQDLKPSINTGWETGLKWQPAPGLDGRLAVWQQTATNEVRKLLNDPNGDSVNVGATRRRGADLQLGWQAAATLQAWAALTLQKAVIIEPDPAAPTTRGHEIDHVPRRLVNAGVDWTVAPAWTLSATLQAQSRYYLDSSNSTGQFGAYTLLNLGARWQLSPAIALQAQLRNAGNAATEYVWHDGTQSLHSAGAPRAFYLGVSARL